MSDTPLRSTSSPYTDGVQALARLCQQHGVEEITASDENWSVRLRLDLAAMVAGAPAPLEIEPDGPYLLLSQWVGIFHRGADSDSEPAAREGRPLKEGDVLGFIAAMQLQHEVVADRPGTLLRFLVEEGMPVEYGQPLAEIG